MPVVPLAAPAPSVAAPARGTPLTPPPAPLLWRLSIPRPVTAAAALKISALRTHLSTAGTRCSAPPTDNPELNPAVRSNAESPMDRRVPIHPRDINNPGALIRAKIDRPRRSACAHAGETPHARTDELP